MAIDLAVEIRDGDFAAPRSLVAGEGFIVPIRVRELAHGGDSFSHRVTVSIHGHDASGTPVSRNLTTTTEQTTVRFEGPTTDEYTRDLFVSIPIDLPNMSDVRFAAGVALVAAPVLDRNVSNDIAFSTEIFNLSRRFGSFDGRANVAMTLPSDDRATKIAFRLHGPGTGEVVAANGSWRLIVEGTTTASEIDIFNFDSRVPGSFSISALEVRSPIGRIVGEVLRVQGPITLTDSIQYLALGDIVGPLNITVPSSSARPNFRFRHVTDLSIDSAVPIGAISAASWRWTSPGHSVITAPALSSLWITREFRALPADGIPANLSVDLRLGSSVNTDTQWTLVSLNVANVVQGGTWIINGGANTVSVGATSAAFAASFTQGLNEFKVANSFRGLLTVGTYLGKLEVGKDVLGAQIYAGRTLGTDGRLGGTGDSEDKYSSGHIREIIVARNIANSTIAAGLAPVAGSPLMQFVNGHSSRIYSTSIGNVLSANSRILAATYADPDFDSVTIRGVTVDWTSDPRFSVAIPPPIVTAGAIRARPASVTFAIDAHACSVLSLPFNPTFIRVVRADGRRLPATVTSIFELDNSFGSHTRFRVIAVTPTGAPFTAADAGTYIVRVLPGAISDNRGNRNALTTLGSVTLTV